MTQRQRRTLVATILGSGVVFLDGSVVNLALPHIAADLHSGFAGLQWVVDGYFLSLSALILLGGSLGDMYGRKRIYLIGAVGFGLTSAMCGFAPTMAFLIAGRLLQGIFGALMVPGALAIINTNFSRGLRAQAVARWTAWTTAVIAIAPLLGGYLIDRGSWRLIFFINVPLLLVCIWLGAAAITEGRDERPRRIDAKGALLAMLSLSGITYGLIEGPGNHWAFWPTVALAAGLCLAFVFLRVERVSRDPMVDLRLFRSRNFSGVNIVTFAMYGALGGFIFALMIYLQTVLRFTSLQAGISMLPTALMLLLLSRRVNAAASRLGPRLFMTFGPIIAGLGIFTLVPLGSGADYLRQILPGVFLFGLGLSLTVAPLTTTMLASVPTVESGIASAINNAVSRVAGLVIIAILGLFGSEHAYQFAAVLCGVLAVGAGLLSFGLISNKQTH